MIKSRATMDDAFHSAYIRVHPICCRKFSIHLRNIVGNHCVALCKRPIEGVDFKQTNKRIHTSICELLLAFRFA